MDLHNISIETTTVRCDPCGRVMTVVKETCLIDAIHQLCLPLSQACDGVALCGFCRVKVMEGLENLTPLAQEEGKILRSLNAGDDERLACCARVLGPVTITTDYW
jgi:adenylate cyclase